MEIEDCKKLINDGKLKEALVCPDCNGKHAVDTKHDKHYGVTTSFAKLLDGILVASCQFCANEWNILVDKA